LNFQLALYLTSQFSALLIPTFHNDSSYTNRVLNPLGGESDEFKSTDSEGYVETEVKWFNKPYIVDVAKQNPSKMLESVTIEVSL